nr:hypothetical protein [uncultured Campylobacter sp.]
MLRIKNLLRLFGAFYQSSLVLHCDAQECVSFADTHFGKNPSKMLASLSFTR